MSAGTRVLIVSNLDSANPFGQFTRPFYLGEGLAEAGMAVGQLGVDATRVTYGPAWSTGTQSMSLLRRALRQAVAEFEPDVLYAHQNLPAVVAIREATG